MGDVMADELEVRPVQQVRDVRFLAREEVVHADDVLAGLDEPVTQVRTEKAGSAGDKNALDHEKTLSTTGDPPARSTRGY